MHFTYLHLLLGVMLSFSLAAQKRQTIQFQSGTHTLAGSLSLPKSKQPAPAIVVLHGSGPATRKFGESQAKFLVKNGFAVLSFDKRGAGESQGSDQDWQYFSLDTLAKDALAAVDFLRTRSEIDGNNIGIFAASQSGWVLPKIILSDTTLAFGVCLSCSVSTVAEDRLYERGARLLHEKFSLNILEEVREMQLADHELTRHPDTDSALEKFASLWSTNRKKSWFSRVYGEAYFKNDPKNNAYRQWFSTVLDYDPTGDLGKINIPILFLFGDPLLDRQGPVELSIKNLNALRDQDKPFAILQYEDTGHNLKKTSYQKDLMQWIVELQLQN